MKNEKLNRSYTSKILDNFFFSSNKLSIQLLSQLSNKRIF